MRKFKLELTLLIAIATNQSIAQSEIGIRATPNISSQPKVVNPSSAYIYGENAIGFDAAVDYTKMFESRNIGLRVGIGIGLVDHRYVFEAPKNAFGTMTGDGNVNVNSSLENYLYNSLSAQFVYRRKIRNLEIEFYTGLTKKFYHHSNEADGIKYAFNRATPYNPDDPNAGLADFSIDIPPIKSQLHIDLPIGIGIRKSFKNQNSLNIGIVKNLNLEPIGKGKMFVQMNNIAYTGEFSPRSSFIGIDLRYAYNLSKKPASPSRQVQNSEGSRYKKAVFLELFGNAYLASINYDMRIKKDRNDGFGVRLGIGKGHFFETDEPTNTGRYTSVPLNVNYIIGTKKSGLETGLGITPSFTFHSVSGNSKNITLGGFANVNYRLQPLKEGLVFRIGFTPFFDRDEFKPTYLSASIGYGFK
ncbi:MAG: hypothetical protein ACYCZO_06115 [Daejeonella sp.]